MAKSSCDFFVVAMVGQCAMGLTGALNSAAYLIVWVVYGKIWDCE